LEQLCEHKGLRSAEIVDGELTLVLNNTLAAVEEGRIEISRFLGPLDTMVQNRLEVLFEELVSNTVRHGFAQNSGQSIHVVVRRGPGAIRLTFEDDGLPFDPTKVDVAARMAGRDPARLGGLGIPLIARLSNSFRYEQPSPGRACEGFCPRNRTIVSVNT
jgi:anti-sigma regulatory factor (Ser/Thr protein kinase)